MHFFCFDKTKIPSKQGSYGNPNKKYNIYLRYNDNGSKLLIRVF